MKPLNLDAINSADIRGEKTCIRPMRLDEASLLYPWTLDPDVRPFWGTDSRYEDLDDFLRQMEPARHYFDGSQPELGRNFIIEADDTVIGMVNTNRIDIRHRSTEIDIVIGHRDYRERGYGSDALRAFLRFLFDDIGLHRVWLGTYEYNARARRVYERLGFIQEGVMREDEYLDGRWINTVIYGILEHEFLRDSQ